MKKLNLLSRAEMKNVMGGVISPEVLLERCLEGKFINPPLLNDGSVEDEIMRGVMESVCYDTYNNIPQ